MKFERKDANVSVAFIPCVIRTGYRTERGGYTKKIQMAVRAIRERSGKWRIDKTAAVASAWMPWEPVNTTEYNSLTAAKTGLREFARACKTPPSTFGRRR